MNEQTNYNDTIQTNNNIKFRQFTNEPR